MDNLSKIQRHKVMSKIKQSGTEPEKRLRKALSNLKSSLEFNPVDIIGKPDIIFRRQKIAIFVDGCFWHGCEVCKDIPKTNHDFWEKKIEYNKKRRKLVKRTLKKEGWVVREFW